MKILLLLLFISISFQVSSTTQKKWDVRSLKWGFDPIKVEMIEGNGNNISRKYGNYKVMIKFRYQDEKLYKVTFSSFNTRFFNKDMNMEFIGKVSSDFGEKKLGYNYEELWKLLYGRKYMLMKESPESGIVIENIYKDGNYSGLNKLKYPEMWKNILNNAFVKFYIWEGERTAVIVDQRKNVLTFFDIRCYYKYKRKIAEFIEDLKNQSMK